MLQLINIEKKYTTGDLTQAALNGVSLNLRDSEFVAILGPSGSGKTTLLNIIGGLDRYDNGELIINGISTRRYTDRDWDSYRNHTVGFVFQSYNLIPHQTVLANVELALTISGVSGAERRRRAAEALRQVGLGDQLHKRPTEMSGGQMQRVAIARALVNNPDILLADEPTGALDSKSSRLLLERLEVLNRERGATILMVTHDAFAASYTNRVLFIKDGEVFHQLYRGSLGRDEMYQKIVESREVDEEEARNTAKIIALSAIKYGDLSNQASKDYIFDIDKFTSFEGDTGPYILYTIVRIKSILAKAKEQGEDLTNLTLKEADTDSQKALMMTIARFNAMMENAYDEVAPHKICAYIYDLANALNRFYHENRILAEEDETKKRSWLGLLILTKEILEACIDVLGFSAPERM